jgi:hypothetical protein
MFIQNGKASGNAMSLMQHSRCGAPRHRIPAETGDLAIFYRLVIEHAVATTFGVPVEALRRPSRGAAPVALARQVAMYLAHVVIGTRLTTIAHACGRDRATVRHACGVVEDRRDDPAFNRTVDLLEGIIGRVHATAAPLASSPSFVARSETGQERVPHAVH